MRKVMDSLVDWMLCKAICKNCTVSEKKQMLNDEYARGKVVIIISQT